LPALLGAGVPLVYGLNVARRSIGNQILVDAVGQSIERVQQGGRLGQSLAECKALFSGSVLEEKVAAVFLLEDLHANCGDREFKLFESWLDRISSWADHDGLVHGLISPMAAAKPARLKAVFRWAKSPKRWHRRAACVALIRGARAKLFFPDVVKLSNLLVADEDDMVQKGLGWLLRETAKFDAKRTVPYLMKIRARAPRLVLRTACETLPVNVRKKVLAQK